MAANPSKAVEPAPMAWPSLAEIHDKLSWLDGLRPHFHAKSLDTWFAEWKRLHDSLSIVFQDMSFIVPVPEKAKQANKDLRNHWFGSLAAFAEQQGHFATPQEGKITFPDVPWLSEPPRECFSLQLDTVQTIVRELAMVVSRPRIRALTVFDLPEEIMRAIFGYFGPESGSQPRDIESHLYADDDFGYRDIQRIRLACRRFHDASSHLLLQCVIVEMRPESLERLQKIADHPLIGKGIDTIAVDLKYYSNKLASSLGFFTQLATEHLEAQIESYIEGNKPDMMSFSRRPSVFGLDHRVYSLVDQKATMISQEWCDFHALVYENFLPMQEPRGQDLRLETMVRKAMLSTNSVAGLVRAHKVYVERYRAQQELITSGTFFRAIVSALAKMPCATRLHVGDSFYTPSRCSFPSKPFPMAVNDPQYLAESAVTRSSTWLDAIRNGARDIPRSVFIDTLMAVFGSGHNVRGLVINMSVDPAVHIPATQGQLDLLKQTTQDMLVFELSCRSAWLPPEEKALWVSGGLAQPTTIESVALACAGFKRVREFAMDFMMQLNPPDTYDETQARTRGARICRQPFLELENLALSSVGLHLGELKMLLQHMPQTCRSVMIESLWLFSGTWVEALDLLRDHYDKGTWITLYGHCRGGECEGLERSKQSLLFQPRKTMGKKIVVGRADAYIRREGDQAVNPFNDLDALLTNLVPFDGGFLPLHGIPGLDSDEFFSGSDFTVSGSYESETNTDSGESIYL